MKIGRTTFAALAMLALSGSVAFAQGEKIDVVRERANVPYKAGMEYLREENFEAATRSFRQATELDPTFSMAYYMLGRTHMMTRSYTAAVVALTKSRDLYLAESSKQMLNKQELKQIRREQIGEINDRINELEAVLRRPGTRNAAQLQNDIQMLQERRRQLQDAERELTPELAVPSYVSLSLGSAHFRSGNLAEAETAYRAAIAADAKVGEAHSNLAVVYMETKRYAEAEKSVQAAEKVGFRVAPALKEEIKKRKAAGG